MYYKRSVFILLIFLAIACSKNEHTYPVKIIGHAGSGLDVEVNPFPENTNDAVRNAISQGVTAVELDVQLSADNQLILYHDNYLVSRSSCQGCIPSMDYSVLQSCYYGLYPNYAIELLKNVDFSGVDEIFLDLKHMNFCENLPIDANRYYNALEKFTKKVLDKHVVVLSSNISLLSVLKDLPVETAFVYNDVATILSILSSHKFDMGVIRNKFISVDQVQQIQKMGKKVIIFDAKSFEGNKSALEKLPDYLMTDDLVSGVALTE